MMRATAACGLWFSLRTQESGSLSCPNCRKPKPKPLVQLKYKSVARLTSLNLNIHTIPKIILMAQDERLYLTFPFS